MIAVTIAALVLGGPDAATLALAVAAFGAVGLADDLAGLPAGRRLLLQLAASIAVAGALLRQAGLQPAEFGAAVVLAAFWVMAFVNAFNFMDGVNGISGVHAVIGGACYAFLGVRASDTSLAGAACAVAAGGLAFLPWNALRARVFLGDVGSYGIGAALAVLAGISLISRLPPEAVCGPAALYLADTGWTLQRRIRAGEQVLRPHRSHVYQRLCDAGLSHQQVTIGAGACTVLVSLLGMASLSGNLGIRAAADLAAAALLVAYLRSPVLIGRLVPRLERA